MYKHKLPSEKHRSPSCCPGKLAIDTNKHSESWNDGISTLCK